MEKEKLESLIIDFIDGKLLEDERKIVEQELMRNPAAYKLYEELKEVMQAMHTASRLEPSANLKLQFDKMLAEEMQQQKPAKTIFFQPVFYRVAAAVLLLVLGGGVGFWISRQQQQAEELRAMKEEMEKTKQMMMGMLDNQESASQRLMGANVAYKTIVKADDEIVNALVNTMNEDPNTNVRMAALEALSKFHSQPHVRKALIASLRTQKDPLVQIALIHLMIDMKEKGITEELKRITTDDEALPAVKDEAHVGLLKLS
ncbi:HEAT repeat domain-containing protein [Chryseolinea lacunae]|uniref:HEAT repeat domain-containing protein n=1 Tax=Chryseolinea lacunae TaxID=2801331 RepID=A0ABS1L009_9BACT|nr:HEAT repeat domain-containing protein [Chryseolinea lacunae]MBL0745030.1 HEAT repeat domain-containing protein [Chryseolinea lacunae]